MSTVSWTQRPSVGTSGRWGHVMVHDSARGETLLLGGYSPDGILGDFLSYQFAPACHCDFTDDGYVGLADLAQLISNYGQIAFMRHADGDTDCDGDIDVVDLATLLSVYGTTCP